MRPAPPSRPRSVRQELAHGRDHAAIQFTRRNLVLSLLLALIGSLAGMVALIILIVLAFMSGLILPDWFYSLAQWTRLLLSSASMITGSLLFGLGIKERLDFDLERGRLLVRGIWLGIPGLCTDLCNLDEIQGIQVEAGQNARLQAYVLFSRSPFGDFSFFSFACLTDSMADVAHTWLGRTLLEKGPPPDDLAARKIWLSKLEDLAETLDVSLRLPCAESVTALLEPRPPDKALPERQGGADSCPAERKKPPADSTDCGARERNDDP